MTSPGRRMRLSANRTSLTGRTSLGPAPRTALRTSTSAANARNTHSQQTYDIITGEPIEPVTKQRRLSKAEDDGPNQTLRRPTSRQSMLPRPEQSVAVISQQKYQEDTLALQSKIKSLEYELEERKNEQDRTSLAFQKEIDEAKLKSDNEFKRYQNAESERLKAVRQFEGTREELREVRDNGINSKTALERRLRDLQATTDKLREDKEDLEERLNDADREMRRILVDEVEGKRSRLERTLEETKGELADIKTRFDNINGKLQSKEKQTEDLEDLILKLRSQAGGGEELEVVKRELNEQMTYVRRLENQNREHNNELRKLQDERRSVNVVMEERRALEVQLQVLKDLERRNNELEIQKEILDDEKRTWTSLLEKEGEEGQGEFESPEAVVKALVNERIEHALALERLGVAEAEVAGKDEAVRAIESERTVLQAEIQRLTDNNASGTTSSVVPDSKAYTRLDRQRQLVTKEVEYLRAQLKTFDTEETTMMGNENFDTQRADQVQKLESMLDEYKNEVQQLHKQLTDLETSPHSGSRQSEPRGTKRPSEEPENSEQMGQLLRKNKMLQTALEKTTKTSKVLATELQATKSQLKALRASASTRILELRDNPTANAEAIKMSTLRTLKQENTDLLAQVRGEDLTKVKMVPVSTLDALKLDLSDMEKVVAERDKRMRRQREIWTLKAAEFREVVASLLGYRVKFMPNGKVKVSSMYHGDAETRRAREEGEQGDDADGGDDENYIMFDGERGEMKIGGGGAVGAFGMELSELVDFWVKQKGEIPCFLAAMTLEFYEKYGSISGR